jgi:hypothetical protein
MLAVFVKRLIQPRSSYAEAITSCLKPRPPDAVGFPRITYALLMDDYDGFCSFSGLMTHHEDVYVS